ncbi:MAG: glycosyltransferase family protein [Candidatus Altiarchaeales archaeon]|nr:glycosyltransferase family protein [Candidatus Altiarchaeales archaeon]
MQDTVAIVQARMGSTRLPGKVMKDLLGKPMLQHMMERLSMAEAIDKIVIATSEREENRVVVELSKKLGIEYFIGSEDDVLDRYMKAAREFNASTVVRIGADEPLVDPGIVDLVIAKHFESEADLTTTMFRRTFPKGVDLEVMPIEVLERMNRLAKLPEDREHVTLYAYNNPDVFRINNVEAEGKLRRPEITLTVDTQEDFNRVEKIFKNLYTKNSAFNTEDVIDFLDS